MKGTGEYLLNMVWRTTALPKPRGNCSRDKAQHFTTSVLLTMANQRRRGCECSDIELIRIVEINGSMPHMRVKVLYLPVRCITQLSGGTR